MSTRTILTAGEAAEVLASVRYVLLDVDGVLWAGKHVLPNIPETLSYLRLREKQIRFLTNNASISRAGMVREFQRRGIQGVREGEVYNSGFAAALRLQSLFTANKSTGSDRPLVERNIFVIGEEGLHEEMRRYWHLDTLPTGWNCMTRKSVAATTHTLWRLRGSNASFQRHSNLPPLPVG
ncbi:putative p-nitrophenylphosphatase [Trypanosoma cruzi]|uniref:Putative p-nitrophenylphosphatase n=1 Tax=Trypanosoma cruzi TaxID=5693 RepID=A0A2V2UN88_TRYCR|nr:putative p-nitrophenylphosphatase [Trypanosoma cruzi]